MSTCRVCGSNKIESTVKDITRKYKGQTYIVPAVKFYMYPNCGEKVYDRAAMQKIQACSPAYRHEDALAEP